MSKLNLEQLLALIGRLGELLDSGMHEAARELRRRSMEDDPAFDLVAEFQSLTARQISLAFARWTHEVESGPSSQ